MTRVLVTGEQVDEEHSGRNVVELAPEYPVLEDLSPTNTRNTP